MQAAGAAAVTVVLYDGDTVGGATGAAFVYSTSTLMKPPFTSMQTDILDLNISATLPKP